MLGTGGQRQHNNARLWPQHEMLEILSATDAGAQSALRKSAQLPHADGRPAGQCQRVQQSNLHQLNARIRRASIQSHQHRGHRRGPNKQLQFHARAALSDENKRFPCAHLLHRAGHAVRQNAHGGVDSLRQK